MVSQCAMRCGVKSFKSIYKGYVEAQKKASGTFELDNVTQFEDQPMELNCGKWIADDAGITCIGPYGAEVEALNHPLLPVLRLVNVDTGEEKLKLAYRKGKRWRYILAEKHNLASKNGILELAKVGIAVNSENAAYLIKYLYDIESLNYDVLPEKNSVSRLGWINDEEFSPYVENLIYDGGKSFGRLFESVTQCGSFQEWKELALSVRKAGAPARVALAASFASVLISKLDGLSFFVHLWGSKSGIGKTVGLMFAASVWASPAAGDYVRTFKGTEVSLELSAGFVNSLPLILDEFQMVRNKKDFEGIVYMLAEGIGKSRGSKNGGLRDSCTWKNCIITSGESPITNYMSGAGAFNRIVEVECTEPLFEDPIRALAVMKRSYGHAGRMFVERLQNPQNVLLAKEKYLEYYNQINESDTTEKQAMAGAVLLTADYLATQWIFEDGNNLKFEELSPYLHTRHEVDTGQRAYDYLCESIAANMNRFNPSIENVEHWGKLSVDGKTAYIISRFFDQMCEDGGFSSKSVLSWLRDNNLIECQSEGGKKVRFAKVVKIGSSSVRCVALALKDDPDEMEYYSEII